MKIIELILLLVFYSIIAIDNISKLPAAANIALTAVVSLLYLAALFRGEKLPVKSKRLSTLKSGTKLIWLSGMAVIPEAALIAAYTRHPLAGTLSTALTIGFAVLFSIVTFIVGFIKTAVSAKQIKLIDYILLLIFWWTPVVNLFLIRKMYRTARRELMFELDKLALEDSRAASEICRTKYPIVMVHGIFFRDWQLLNYWGRVPAALKQNGAEIYYGDQQSALSIPDSAAELKANIMRIIAETGAEKVNIIAHSKGGLDSRYAISQLGLDKYVATLTTINTPHKGCDMVDYLLGRLPDKTVQSIAKKYNGIFCKLGDSQPDFLAGVKDLSAKKMAESEHLFADSPDVSYRSRMSEMKNVFSAGVPLNLGYTIIKRLNGKNDGLVWTNSAEHGRFSVVTAKGRRGISHGDMIDLFRENIDGFDVREYYVDLVAELKREGY